MFSTNNVPKSELTNNCEPVLFSCFAEISYVNPYRLSNTINISLSVVEKSSNQVLATDII